MLGPLTFAFRMTDGTERLDSAGLRGLLLAALARGAEGLVACDERDGVLFACPRANKLLEGLGGLRDGLPQEIRAVLGEWREVGEPTLARRVRVHLGRAVHVCVAAPWGIPSVRAVLWLQEEHPRDDRLYAAMNEQYGLPRRSFQLALLVRQGLSNREIARELRLSEATVKVYLHQLYRACGVPSRTALVALMQRARDAKDDG